MPERILITVKTYPTLSKKYGELVCTAGFREDGSWVRIYPVPFRRLDDYLRYKKWVWVELALTRNTKDPRPESYRPTDLDAMKIGDEMPPGEDWANRREIVLQRAAVYDDMAQLIRLANKENALSLAVFRPTTILNFVVEEVDRAWDKDTMAILEKEAMQGDLFASAKDIKAEFKVVQKVPYRFSYRFADVTGRESTLMIEDWEIGQLYWNCLKQSDGNEAKAVEAVRNKYLTEFMTKRDVAFFLGTTRQYHGWASNPFVIIGVFYPPASKQISLDLC
jgi:hypothetical protein